MMFCVVGSGLSGAVVARALAEVGHNVTIFEEREYLAGNCHTQRDLNTGILVHIYGPHIFHTDNKDVWDYVNSFCEMMTYTNRVKAVSGNRIYSLPINLLTINQFFGTMFSPGEAREFISRKARKDIINPCNFEEQALSMLGDELYQAFFYGYTRKQWGVEPATLPASILKRLPLRFNYNDNYFKHNYQGIPKDGYTALIEKILDHQGIDYFLNSKFEDVDASGYEHVFYTGQIDRYFGYSCGRLGYRTLDFEKFYADGDYQGTAVMNYCDQHIPFTRITEHKHFAPWEADAFEKTVCYREFSRECGALDVPYYPIRRVEEKKLLAKYVSLANSQQKVTFIGRQGTYRYLDMDVTIAEALQAAGRTLDLINSKSDIPSFFVDPLV